MAQAVIVDSVSGVYDVRARGEVSRFLVCQTLNKLPGLNVIGYIYVSLCYQPIGEHELCLQDTVLCLGMQ